MSLEIVRRIRGNVHGSIDITELEDKVLMHSTFKGFDELSNWLFFIMFFQELLILDSSIVWVLCTLLV